MVRACISVFEEIDLPLALENRWLDLYNELDIQQTLQQSTCIEPDMADEVDEPAEPAELAEVDISDLPIFDGDMGVYNNTAGLRELADLPALDAPEGNLQESFEEMPAFPGELGSMIGGGEFHRSLEDLEDLGPLEEWDGGFSRISDSVPAMLNMNEIPEDLPYGLPDVEDLSDMSDLLSSNYIW